MRIIRMFLFGFVLCVALASCAEEEIVDHTVAGEYVRPFSVAFFADELRQFAVNGANIGPVRTLTNAISVGKAYIEENGVISEDRHIRVYFDYDEEIWLVSARLIPPNGNQNYLDDPPMLLLRTDGTVLAYWAG